MMIIKITESINSTLNLWENLQIIQDKWLNKSCLTFIKRDLSLKHLRIIKLKINNLKMLSKNSFKKLKVDFAITKTTKILKQYYKARKFNLISKLTFKESLFRWVLTCLIICLAFIMTKFWLRYLNFSI